MLTGDNKSAAEFIGKNAGIDEIYSELLPADKEKTIRSLQEKGEKAVKTVKNLGSAVVIIANSKRKSVMEEGQDENDALAATEDVRDELDHGLRKLPQKRKKPESRPQKEKAKATQTDSALKSGEKFLT